ncbi:MAG: sigma-E factor regulatory protein RseB domain-containing protein [Armatimonas sp.]
MRLAFALALGLTLTAGSTFAQRPFGQRSVPQRPPKARLQPQLEPARQLLRRMIQAEQARSFTAREVVTREDGKSIEQVVKHDPRRGVRRELVRPAGEVIIDNGSRSWRLNRKRVLESDSKQVGVQRRLKDMLTRINRVPLTLQGQDMVAGRTADIVSLGLPGGGERRFWIDRESGLRLKTEEKGPDGRIRSNAYYLSIDLKPQFTDTDFAPPVATAERPVVRENRKTFKTIEEANRAGVTIHPPDWLPGGFTLRTVESNGERITLRYSNGMSALSVARLAVTPPRLIRAGDGPVPLPGTNTGYFVRGGDGNYLLIGSLSEGDLKRVADSLK